MFKVAAALRKHLVGKVLEHVEIELRRAPSLEREVVAIRTIGKHLLIDLEGGESVRCHLGMHGSWHRYPRGARFKRAPAEASLLLETGDQILVCFSAEEVECFSRDRAKAHPILSRLGPDLLDVKNDLDPAPGGVEVAAEIERRARHFLRANASVVDLLLDQRVACGLGNVYKSEVLYLERVHPKTAVASLDSSQIAVLYRTGQSLLRSNLGPGWRNTRLEAAAAGPRAGNRDRLWVYGRRGQPCHRCGSAISYARLGRGNRSTYWCDACQIRAPFSE